ARVTGSSTSIAIVAGNVSPGPKLSSIHSKAVTEPKPSLNSAKESYDSSPSYRSKGGSTTIAMIAKAKIGRLHENVPASFQMRLSLCSTFLSNGQNRRFPNRTKKNGTKVTNAIKMTRTPIATATAD